MEEEKKNTPPSGTAGEQSRHGGHHNRRRRGGHRPHNRPAVSQAEQAAPAAEEKQQSKAENGKGQQGNRNAHHQRRHHHSHHRQPAQQTATAETEREILTAEATADDVQAEATSAEPSIPVVEDEPMPVVTKPPKSEVMVDVVGIRFKSTGKTYYFDPNGIQATKGHYAIVDTARGQEYGEVTLGNTQVSESDIVPPLRPLLRMATEADKRHHEENAQREEFAFKTCNERIAAHNLDMKLIDAQYTFDNSKLLFYFTSSGRVDFRELVKDLASVFRTRIELRQIGIRDEAKMIGGLGMCGRPLCCTSFLSDFGQVSIKMAKEQNLSLNSSKISGACGRLMCCLRYEHDTYEYEIKRTPPVDAVVKTPDGVGYVTEINPLLGMCKVKLSDKPDNAPLPYHRDQLTVLQKKRDKNNS